MNTPHTIALWILAATAAIAVGCADGPRVRDSIIAGDADTASILAKIQRAETRLVGINKEIQRNTYERLDSGRDTTIGLTGGAVLAAFVAWRLSLVAAEWMRCKLRKRLIRHRAPPMID